GDNIEASHFDTLWVDTSPNQPLTRDCTVITNGANYLKLYMDNVLVYSSSTLALGMPAPFDYYLQTMNSYYNQMRYGTFKDYYATTDENIKITNNPSGAATVSLVDSSGNTLASSSVTAGSATLDVGKYHFPISGTLNVYDSSNNVIASSAENIYGGDVFSVDASTGGNPTAPQPPTNLSATAASSSTINLSWSAPSDNGGSAITGYDIERSTDSGSTWNTLDANTGSSSTAYSDTRLSPSTSYMYRVSAINSVGTSSPSNTASATTFAAATAPQPPTGLAANAISSSEIDLSWTAPSNDGGAAITGYMIERSQDSGSTWSTISSDTGSAGTTYSDTGLAPSTGYTYRVSAINSVGTSSPSNTASATTSVSTSVPQPPTGLTASAVSSSTINLSWNAPGNDGGSAIIGYKIERSTMGEAWSVIVSNTGSTSTTYSDTGLIPLLTYNYRVSAINSVGTSLPSNTASTTTHLVGPVPIPGNLIGSL
ncbi:MAG TPA: fibronectin type III domain-containing protein, partial [Candidatus Nitrosotalea sp.]|nr:fibronectin type III domain-containing protein [Candidatus Nitrosotalea sp.]